MKNFRLPALALAGALSLSILTACSPKEPDPTPAPTDTPVVTAAPSETPEPEVTESAEPEESDTPAPIPSDVQVSPIETPKPTVKPTPAPVETPPAQESEALTASAIWDKVSAGLDLPALTDLDDDLLSDIYGIDAADLESYVCKLPLMNVHATEFFIAQVKEGKLDAVKSAVEARQAALEEQWKQYLPDQLELVQNYKLTTSGSYLLFAIGEDAAGVETAFLDCTK